jgi:hypothetical protein
MRALKDRLIAQRRALGQRAPFLLKPPTEWLGYLASSTSKESVVLTQDRLALVTVPPLDPGVASGPKGGSLGPCLR